MTSKVNLSPLRLTDGFGQDLLNTMGAHVWECSRLIYSIKQRLYELVQLNVSANPPTKRHDSAPAIVAGSKRNLDDLKRIQSMLKGYILREKQNKNQQKQQQNLNYITLNNQKYIGKEIIGKQAIIKNNRQFKQVEQVQLNNKQSLGLDNTQNKDESMKQRQQVIAKTGTHTFYDDIENIIEKEKDNSYKYKYKQQTVEKSTNLLKQQYTIEQNPTKMSELNKHNLQLKNNNDDEITSNQYYLTGIKNINQRNSQCLKLTQQIKHKLINRLQTTS